MEKVGWVEMKNEFYDDDPELCAFILTVLQSQGPMPNFTRANSEVPGGDHNWYPIQADVHTQFIPEYFWGCLKCGALLKPKTKHWKSDEKARREAPSCPGPPNQ